MKLWPDRAFGGSSPVQATLRHSIIVYIGKITSLFASEFMK